LAQVAEKYVKKGTQIYIEGRIKTRSYDDADGNKKYITEIVGDQMTLLGRRPDDDGMQSASGGGKAATGGGQAPQGAQTPQGAQAPQSTQTPSGGQSAEGGDQAPSQKQGGDAGTTPSSDPFDGGDNGPDDLPF
jgi:single-strand DNA-binding protein